MRTRVVDGYSRWRKSRTAIRMCLRKTALRKRMSYKIGKYLLAKWTQSPILPSVVTNVYIGYVLYVSCGGPRTVFSEFNGLLKLNENDRNEILIVGGYTYTKITYLYGFLFFRQLFFNFTFSSFWTLVYLLSDDQHFFFFIFLSKFELMRINMLCFCNYSLW